MFLEAALSCQRVWRDDKRREVQLTPSLPPGVIEPIFSVLTYSFRLPGREFKSCGQDSDLPQSSIFKSFQSPAAFQTHRNKFPGSGSPAARPLCGSAQPSVRPVPQSHLSPGVSPECTPSSHCGRCERPRPAPHRPQPGLSSLEPLLVSVPKQHGVTRLAPKRLIPQVSTEGDKQRCQRPKNSPQQAS